MLFCEQNLIQDERMMQQMILSLTEVGQVNNVLTCNISIFRLHIF